MADTQHTVQDLNPDRDDDRFCGNCNIHITDDMESGFHYGTDWCQNCLDTEADEERERERDG